MKNRIINSVITTLDKNLPTILTGISVVSGLVTTGYAVYAGYKTKEDLSDISDDAKILEKIKVIGPKFVPVFLGASMSAGCAIAANHENGKRYAALAATLAATRLDTAKLQAKAEEILGKEKVERIKGDIAENEANETAKKFAMMPGISTEEIIIHDKETGYMFNTNLRDFYKEVLNFNQSCELEETPIETFYENLLGDAYKGAGTHRMVGFGKETIEPFFRPEFDIEMGPNMKPIYTIRYPYADISVDAHQRKWDRKFAHNM